MAVSIIQNYGSNNNPANAPFSGPLAALYNNRYAYQALQYPRDLGSTYKGHIVKFDVYEVVPKTLEDVRKIVVDTAKDTAKATLEAGSSAINGLSTLAAKASKDGVEAVINEFTESAAKTWDKFVAGEYTTTTLSVQPQVSDIKATIMLYMPDTVDFTYASSYNDLSLADAAGSLPLVGKIAQAVTSGEYGIGNNAAMRLALNAAGYVFNPQQQLLFQGIEIGRAHV